MDLLAIRNSLATVSERTSRIHARMLADSRNLRRSNFDRISPRDLELLFDLYDAEFFGQYLRELHPRRSPAPLVFRLSKTMTSAGGKTYRYVQRGVDSIRMYEIAISSHLLFDNFNTPGEQLSVVGMVCTSRLQALQRIMEHEMLHLAEYLVWDQSSCAEPRFKSLALNIFAHEHTTHELVTTRQRAAVDHGIRGGTQVEFEFRGQRFVGIVNRIAKRATVLVPDERGMPYTDGRKYVKYYIPVAHLKVV